MAELLSIRAVKKSFGPTVALGGVDLEARAGEVHAVLGENGAGKSTLMNVLAGATRPDEGALLLDARPYVPSSPREAQEAGVAMVHQELTLCAHLSVGANVMLGREPSRFGLIDRRALERRAGAALEAAAGPERARSIGLETLVRALSPADRQLVEIARALVDETCRVLILDEPTSSLGREEVRVLFDRVRAMKERGLLVLYISHFLEEVAQIADRFTVLRDGKTVATGDAKTTPLSEIVEKMAGRAVGQLFARGERSAGEVVLRVEDLAGETRPVRASFELRRGEVLGVAGLVGAGRTELLRTIFGLDRVKSGRIAVLGRTGPASPAERLAHGAGMLSEDRKGEGLALGMSVADNLTLSKLDPFVLGSRQRSAAMRWIERLRVRCRDVAQPVADLSGGNQQKIALGRLLHQDADVLLLDEPTRGIDVAAKADIYRLIDELAARGKAVLVVSDDLGELLGLCDRIAVMHRGVLGAARPAGEWTESSLLAEAVGAEGAA